jgi:hypothetical protein
MILLQQLAAARRARAHAAPPPVQRPAPAPPAAPGENWMRGFFKGVKE